MKVLGSAVSTWLLLASASAVANGSSSSNIAAFAPARIQRSRHAAQTPLVVLPMAATVDDPQQQQYLNNYNGNNSNGNNSNGNNSIDDAVIRAAYDQWRQEYGKAEFNADRYEQFKINHLALAEKNVEMQQQAMKGGRPVPADMTLNEYGDYSLEEYQALLNGDRLHKRTLPVMSNDKLALANRLGIDSIDELEVTLAAFESPIDLSNGVLDPATVERESLVRAYYSEARVAYMAWCQKYEKEQDPIRFSTFASNFAAMKDFALKNGKQVQLNQYADFTQQEYQQLIQSEIERVHEQVADRRVKHAQTAGTWIIPEDAASRATTQVATEVTPATTTAAVNGSGSGMQSYVDSLNGATAATPIEPEEPVFEEAQAASINGANDAAPAQSAITTTSYLDNLSLNTIADDTEQPPSSSSGTGSYLDSLAAAPQPNEPDSAGRSTQLVDDLPPSGSDGSAQDAYGRPVVAAQPMQGTQVVRMGGNSPPVRGTQVIQRAGSVAGTQVIQSASAVDPQPRGTQVIQRASDQQRPVQGTQVIQRASDQQQPPIRGTQVIQRASTTHQQPRVQGTQVIQRASDQQQPPVRGTQVIQRASDQQQPPMQGTQVIQRAAPANQQAPVQGAQVIQRASDATGSVEANAPALVEDETARKTALIEDTTAPTTTTTGNDNAGDTATEKKTLLIPDAPESDGNPPPFNYDGPARSTVVITKEQQQQLQQEQQQQQQPKPESTGNPFAFLQSITKEAASLLGASSPNKPEEYNVSNPAPRGTIVIQKGTPRAQTPARGTVVIQKNGGRVQSESSAAAASTAVPATNDRPTQVIRPNTAAPPQTNENVRGTVVIKKNTNAPGQVPMGTQVIQRAPQGHAAEDKKSLPPKWDFLGSSTTDQPPAPQGTIVLQRRSDAAAAATNDGKPSIMSFFGGMKRDTNPRTVRGTITLQKETKRSPLSLFGGGKAASKDPIVRKTLVINSNSKKSSIFDFLGGATKRQPQAAATSAKADGDKKITIVIKKNDENFLNVAYSLIAGGVRSPESVSRSIKLPKKSRSEKEQIENQVARARAKHLERKQKRLETEARQAESLRKAMEEKAEAARKKASKLKKGDEDSAPAFSFLNNLMGQSEESMASSTTTQKPKKTPVPPTQKAPIHNEEKPKSYAFWNKDTPKTDTKKSKPAVDTSNMPTLRRWKQNADGSVTGLIRNSKNFANNTKVTTSPLPRNATAQKGVIKTVTGSQYRLM